MDPFESPRFLIRQTEMEVAELLRLFQGWVATNPVRREIETDHLTGRKTFKGVFPTRLPERMRKICATAIIDLRHSLDQATCAALETVTGARSGLVYFPIATSPNDLAGRIDKFPSELRPAFSSFRSYPTSEAHGPGNDLVCALAKAAQQKHRISCGVAGFAAEVRSPDGRYGRIKFDPDGDGTFSIIPRWDPEKNEMILATSGPNGSLMYDMSIKVQLSLTDAGPLTGAPAISILTSLCREVSAIVATLESETTRIVSK